MMPAQQTGGHGGSQLASPIRGRHGESGGPSPYGAMAPPSSQAGSVMGSPTDAVASYANSLTELLHAAEAADVDGSGRLYGSQILTCCRVQGIEEPSGFLRHMIADCQAEDGRIDYLKFVQQLAAQRATNHARASVEHLFSQPSESD